MLETADRAKESLQPTEFSSTRKQKLARASPFREYDKLEFERSAIDAVDEVTQWETARR